MLSLLPVVALGFVLAHVLQAQAVDRALNDASESARLIARIGIQPRLRPQDLSRGMTAGEVSSLDSQLRERSSAQNLARVKIWNTRYEIVYSDDHALIGHSFRRGSDDELGDALAGRPHDAAVVNPSPNTETASEVGLGRLVEVYVPLRFTSTGRPVGAFEIYLSDGPLAQSIAADNRMIVLMVSIGLALLWAALFPIVARASRRLRRQAEENYRLARYDTLTRLPNRTMFIKRLEDATRTHGGHELGLAVFLVDIEGFREINDTLGHSTGDHVLIEVGDRLSSELPEGIAVARLGGDEYAVLASAITDSTAARASAAAIQSALARPISVDGVALNIEASIGVALSEERGADASLLRRADVALAWAKSHRSAVAIYSPTYDRSDAGRLKLLGEVRPALERHEFVLHYQPKMNLTTRRIDGVEALLRWVHPERGMVAPLEFIPLVEQTALVGPLTLYVIDEALRVLAAWQATTGTLKMAVNLSVRNLVDRELPHHVDALLERHRVAPEQLIFEVTESVAMTDPDTAVGALEALRQRGIGISIDDFGTGHASIAYLAKLPATELKIDRSFVTDLDGDSGSQEIVRSTIDLARHLGLSVVAEGVESDECLARLTELGCDLAQGFVIARPMPAHEFPGWLRAANRSGDRALSPARRSAA